MEYSWSDRWIALVAILGSAAVVAYFFYETWFRPSAYRERSVNWVRDLWPAREYFRWWYGSAGWLWSSRFAYTLFMLVFVWIFWGFVGTLLGC